MSDDERTPAQGWQFCEGAGELGVVVSERWLRCPVCRWVGFDTRKGQVKALPQHQRPSVAGQGSLFT